MITNICVEGIDRCGKGTVAEYVKQMSEHKYTVYDRGVLSEITYARMFGRKAEYDLRPYEHFVFVYLVCDEEDWNVRCKMTNEPKIDYWQNLMAFNNTAKDFKYNGYRMLEFNTSQMTPYQIAKIVLKYMEDLNASESKQS